MLVELSAMQVYAVIYLVVLCTCVNVLISFSTSKLKSKLDYWLEERIMSGLPMSANFCTLGCIFF